MVNRIFSFLSREVNGVHQAAFLLGIFAILSQVLGLLRDRLLAGTFGAGVELDIYYAAFRIPDFLFVTIGSLVSVSVLIPFLIEKLKGGEGEGREFLNAIFSFFVYAICFCGFVIFLLAPKILPILFPGFTAGELADLVLMTRIMLLSPIFLGISGLYSSITQAHSRFFLYAASPLLYNAGIIAGILFLVPKFGLPGLAMGVSLGALLHLLIQMPFARDLDLAPRLTLLPNWNIVKNVATLSVPRTLSLSFQHISILVLIVSASLMAAGSIAIFNLSFNLQSVPLSIIGVSYSLAAFPTLSKLFSSGQREKFLKYIETSARHIIFWSIPFTVIFVVLRAHIVRVILGSGEFDWTDTRLSAAAVALFSFSLIFQGLVLLFTRGFYAMGKTKIPFWSGAAGAISTILFSFILIAYFRENEFFRNFIEAMFKVSDIPGTEILMLPLAFSMGLTLNAAVLLAMFKRHFNTITASLLRTLFQSLSASIIMGFVIFLSLRVLDDFLTLETFWGIFLQGLFSSIGGVAVGAFMLKILGNQEIREIWRTLHQKFWKAKVVGPDPEVI